MRPATRDEDDDENVSNREANAAAPRRAEAEPPVQAAPYAKSQVDRFARKRPPSAWPAHLLLTVGLLVLAIDIVLRLWHVVDVPQTAGVQAASEAAMPVAAAAAVQAVLPEPAAAATTVAAPIPTPVLRPTAVVGRPIAPQPAPPTAPPRPAAPTATPVSELSTASPEGAVRAFYYLLGRRDFQAMVWLFSARMHDTMPSDPGLLNDRTPPGQLMIQQLTLVSVDGERNNATVSVDVLEQLSPADTKHYVGTWKVVRGPTGWLLDEPDIQIE